MRVLLTGATGFIGSHVARVLVTAGCDVQALVRPGAARDRIADLEGRLGIVAGDVASVADPAVLAPLAPEVCIHLAWYAEPGRYLHAVGENLVSMTLPGTGVDGAAKKARARPRRSKAAAK